MGSITELAPAPAGSEAATASISAPAGWKVVYEEVMPYQDMPRALQEVVERTVRLYTASSPAAVKHILEAHYTRYAAYESGLVKAYGTSSLTTLAAVLQALTQRVEVTCRKPRVRLLKHEASGRTVPELALPTVQRWWLPWWATPVTYVTGRPFLELQVDVVLDLDPNTDKVARHKDILRAFPTSVTPSAVAAPAAAAAPASAEAASTGPSVGIGAGAGLTLPGWLKVVVGLPLPVISTLLSI